MLTKQYDLGAQCEILNSCSYTLLLILIRILVMTVSSNVPSKAFFDDVLLRQNITLSVILNFIVNWYPNDTLDLESLSKILVTLLAFTAALTLQT